MKNIIELSIVVLCYRAEKSIIPFFEKVLNLAEKISNNFEIILVGNYIPGTDDQTKDIVIDIAEKHKNVIAITKPKEGMMGWDMLEGLNASRGKYICVIDGDGQFPIDSIEKAYHLITEKRLDMVKTYREIRYDGFYRKLISRGYNYLFSFMFPGLKSKDINSKPKIFTKAIFDRMKLKSTGWFIDAEIMINIRRNKFKFEEFPIVFYDINERSSFVKIGAVLEFIYNLVKYRFKKW